MANETVNTQIRLPAGLHQYIQKEASRMGIANNAFLIMLCELGGKVWDENKRFDISCFPPFDNTVRVLSGNE